MLVLLDDEVILLEPAGLLPDLAGVGDDLSGLETTAAAAVGALGSA